MESLHRETAKKVWLKTSTDKEYTKMYYQEEVKKFFLELLSSKLNCKARIGNEEYSITYHPEDEDDFEYDVEWLRGKCIRYLNQNRW